MDFLLESVSGASSTLHKIIYVQTVLAMVRYENNLSLFWAPISL